MLVVETQSPGGVSGNGEIASLGSVPDGLAGKAVIIPLLTTRHSGFATTCYFDGHCERLDPLVFTRVPPGVTVVTYLTPTYKYYVDVFVSSELPNGW